MTLTLWMLVTFDSVSLHNLYCHFGFLPHVVTLLLLKSCVHIYFQNFQTRDPNNQ
jgi:E3 ubiquitin-protein ligase DOA10